MDSLLEYRRLHVLVCASVLRLCEYIRVDQALTLCCLFACELCKPFAQRAQSKSCAGRLVAAGSLRRFAATLRRRGSATSETWIGGRPSELLLYIIVNWPRLGVYGAIGDSIHNRQASKPCRSTYVRQAARRWACCYLTCAAHECLLQAFVKAFTDICALGFEESVRGPVPISPV